MDRKLAIITLLGAIIIAQSFMLQYACIQWTIWIDQAGIYYQEILKLEKGESCNLHKLGIEEIK